MDIVEYPLLPASSREMVWFCAPASTAGGVQERFPWEVPLCTTGGRAEHGMSEKKQTAILRLLYRGDVVRDSQGAVCMFPLLVELGGG